MRTTATQLFCFISFLGFIGCNFDDHVERKSKSESENDAQVLLKIAGHTEEPVELTEVFLGGGYKSMLKHEDGTWHKSGGMVPSEIFKSIKNEGIYSKKVKYDGEIYIYNYDFANSFIKHPEGFGELLGFIHAQ